MSELEAANMQLTPLQKVTLLKERKSIIQTVMSDLMHKGEHFDVIPGTKKETLMKSGAELLTSVFNLAPKYQIQTKDFDNGHREYTIICELYSVENGKFQGSGVGLCSSLETKYRYKGNTMEETNIQLPENYWDRKKNGEKGLLPAGHKTEKIHNVWKVVKVLEKKENTDIADTYNTILKMGKKRALVDATLTVTGASDIFTQDVEDLVEKDVTPKTDPRKENPKPENTETEQEYLDRTAREQQEQEANTETPEIGKQASKEAVKMFFACRKAKTSEFNDRYPGLEICQSSTGNYVWQPYGTYAATNKKAS